MQLDAKDARFKPHMNMGMERKKIPGGTLIHSECKTTFYKLLQA
jgi:hypothetical protein